MRDIKFRAWHSYQKKMFTPETMTQDQMALLPDGHFANIHSSNKELSVIYTHGEMMPMQYTGLKDKNGVEICEGDMVSCSEYGFFDADKEISTVVFESGGFWLDQHDNEYGWPEQEAIEVIGNIYQNPELLEAIL